MVQEAKWEVEIGVEMWAEILREKATGLLDIPFRELPGSPFS